MKKTVSIWFKSTVLVTLFGLSLSASAGIKEAGGDEELAFKCVSAPYVDSDLKIFGVKIEGVEGGIELVVYVNGELRAEDAGVVEGVTGNYVGQSFDIGFARTASDSSTITAKVETAILGAGQSDSVNCTWTQQ
ncbi:hypothetical protein D3C87_1337080 [compost metagenome]